MFLGRKGCESTLKVFMENNSISPKVSIIMNCFNGSKFLHEAIDSVFQQTYKNWEIIFVDNCSTDQSAEIAKSYGKKVRYCKTDRNIPLYAARNVGLDFVTGDFVAFLDVDDLWLEDKLEKQMLLFDNPDVGFVFTGVDYISDNGEKINRSRIPLKRGNITQALLLQNFIAISSSMVRASIFKENRFLSEFNLLGDHNFWLNISRGNQAEFNPEKLLLCRIHENSTTNKNRGKWIFEMRKQYRQFFLMNGLRYPNILMYAMKCEVGHLLKRF